MNNDEVIGWSPVRVVSQHMVPLEEIPVGGTFQYEGFFWRKFDGGVRKQKGMAPKVLRQLDPKTLVWRR